MEEEEEEEEVEEEEEEEARRRSKLNVGQVRVVNDTPPAECGADAEGGARDG